MNWLILTLLASFVLGIVSIFDKLLLKRRGFSDPWAYTFWLGILGFAALLLLPFGVMPLPLWAIITGLISGAIFLLGIFFFLWALRDGEASEALPIIGGLTPICTYLFGLWILHNELGVGNIIGFSILVVSGIIFLGVEPKKVRLEITTLAIVSSALFGLSNVLKKITFEQGSFLSGFFWMSIGGSLFVLVSLVFPNIRKKVLKTIGESKAVSKTFYFANRLLALMGTVLISLAIAVGHPALVEAAQGFKFIIIFLGGWLILKEGFSGRVLFYKIVATILILFGLGWLGTVGYANSIPVNVHRDITWGVTFSSKYSRALGLDWQDNFNAIVTDLRPKKMRLIAYWDEIEKERGQLDFSDLDWQLSRARDNRISVILILGLRTPRWPECHVPAWAEELAPENREQALYEYIPRVIERYRDDSEIVAWQVENEPFLKFGLCQEREADFLEKEATLVRSLDSSRPIVITDGGEFGLWYRAIKAGDIFGTTMYRRVYPPSIGRYVGIIDYPLSPSFFRLKQKLLRFLTAELTKPFIVIELQAEPWGAVEVPLLSYDEQIKIFNSDYFRDTINYAKAAGFDEYYLWGAEWWYFIKEKRNNLEIWEEAKNVFQSGV